jgi:hypothetical protein
MHTALQVSYPNRPEASAVRGALSMSMSMSMSVPQQMGAAEQELGMPAAGQQAPRPCGCALLHLERARVTRLASTAWPLPTPPHLPPPACVPWSTITIPITLTLRSRKPKPNTLNPCVACTRATGA